MPTRLCRIPFKRAVLATRLLIAVLAFASPLLFAATADAEWRLAVQFLPQVHRQPYSGRVYVFFSRGPGEPRHGPNWFHPEEFLARDVTGWKPGERLVIAPSDGHVLAYPAPVSTLDLNGLRAQAVVRFNPFVRQVGEGAGNGFSPVVTLDDDARGSGPTQLVVDRLVPKPRFPETAWCKELVVPSKVLSAFHGRDVSLAAAIVLPPSYASDPSRRFPTIFTVPGFSGTHFPSRSDPLFPEPSRRGVEFIRIVLDPSCPLGHHVFADSANNGPVGKALVKEFLPAFDHAFRSVADPKARFLTGHSSGGWSTLWLQIVYPQHFGGTWSTSPDPVDFRDFQRVDVYRPGENLYVDASGHDRPLARLGNRVAFTFRSFAKMEDVLGPGGQLHSFEAVFSPRGGDGKPARLWNRQTGAINAEVAKAWEKYDIRLLLERNWKTLGPKLAGKIHVFMGDEDTFYLDGATRLLQESLAGMKSDAVVEIEPGKNHFSLLSPDMVERIRSEMADAYRQAFPQDRH